MLSLEQAISIYTDQINANQRIDLEYFYDNLPHEDISEFKELTQILNLMSSASYTNKFNELFEQLNEYKESIYTLPSVANFKTDSPQSSIDEADQSEIDKLFDEEFGDG